MNTNLTLMKFQRCGERNRYLLSLMYFDVGLFRTTCYHLLAEGGSQRPTSHRSTAPLPSSLVSYRKGKLAAQLTEHFT